MEDGVPELTTKQVELFSMKECATAAQGTMIKNFCGPVSRAKNVSVTIPAKCSDDTKN